MTIDARPLLQSRIAGAFWMLCVVSGIYGLAARGTIAGKDGILVAGGAYLVVTVLLYTLLRPVNQAISLIAAGFGLVGIAASSNGSFYFGIQCILVGCLIVRSTFLPRTIGVLMVIAGCAQLFLLTALLPPSLTDRLAPAGYILDGIGEIALAMWLLAAGVNPLNWQKAAR